ncbi:MAG: FkbM family methyltransferase [Algoriphagus sp.]|uniref:FkbM family methyltransferase n=1 Tax=Algoriphagus sp. TaxID=1872435 RepID=UPI0017D404C5|nr:FkbM family methyltransferase [Algoriphagus sp.]NVJ86802.1 FkbM family methyltransferase [Algoriphagus sp.]
MRNFKVRINIFLHELIFNIINSSDYIKGRLFKNKVISKWISIDPKKTFRGNFPKNDEFSFIQIGGNDGVSFDFLHSEVVMRKSKGIIVEPSPKYFKELANNYKGFPNIRLIRKAIFKNNSSIELYELNDKGLKKIPNWGKGIGSINKKHLSSKNLLDEDFDVFIVDGITFMDLVSMYPEFMEVDYLQIDTEGYDFEILKLIDFSRFKCDFIRYEKANLNEEDKNQSEDLLRKHGYQIIGDQYDNFCLKSHLSYKIKYSRN